MNIHIVEQCTSTNDTLKQLAREGARGGTVLCAKMQTGGRGSKGRSWASEGGGLYMSILVRPNEPPFGDVPLEHWGLTYRSALAVSDVVSEHLGTAAIKWANDVEVHGKKIAGILTEMQYRGNTPEFAVVGIGCNINQQTFPKHLRRPATSWRLEQGKETDIHTVLEAVCAAFQRRMQHDCFEDYLARCVTLGQRVTAMQSGERIEGVAVGIDPSGCLLVSDGGTLTKVHTEVSVARLHDTGSDSIGTKENHHGR